MDSFSDNNSGDISPLIYQHGTKFTYKSSEMIVKPGDIMNYLGYIDEGSVRYLITNENGVENVLMTLKKGDLFGTVPIYLNTSVQNITIITETPVIIYKINRNKYYLLMNTSNVFRESVIKDLCSRTTALIGKIISLSFTTGKERLYDYYLSSIDIDSSIDGIWYELKNQSTQEDLAKIIGVSRVSIYKILNELCEDGLIRIINRKIKVKMQ